MDKAELSKTDEATLFKRLGIIIDKVKRIDEEDPDRQDDPRIDRLLAEGNFITKQLDPIMRERYRHDPAALAEWDEIMHMCDDVDEDHPGEQQSL